MSRDLFADTFTTRPAPKRSKWMIVASFLAHVGVVCALLIIPILSAADAFVLRANDFVVALPAIAVPASPPQPSVASPPSQVNVNPNAAPPAPPVDPVTTEVPPQMNFVPGVPDLRDRLFSGTRGPGVLGAPPGNDVVLAIPPVEKPGPIRPGGDIKAPERIAYTAAIYPTIARAAKVDGRVILEATIDEAGVVRDVRVLRSDPLFDRAAIDAVTQWRYTPTRLNGVPVAVLLTVVVTFTFR